MEFPYYGSEGTTGNLNDVKTLQQKDAIAGDIEDSAAHSMAVRFWYEWAEEGFKKMELDGVTAGRDRYGVAEISVPLNVVKGRNLGPTVAARFCPSPSVNEESVSAPEDAVTVDEIGLASGDPDRIQPSWRTWRQFDRAYEGRLLISRAELKMKFAVMGWLHILERTDVYCGGTGVGNRIKVAQQRMAVELHINVANVLRVFFLIAGAFPKRIGKVEPQFVDSGQ